MPIKFQCGDVMLGPFVIWAIVDLILNWTSYNECNKPLGIWIIVSMVIIIIMRIY